MMSELYYTCALCVACFFICKLGIKMADAIEVLWAQDAQKIYGQLIATAKNREEELGAARLRIYELEIAIEDRDEELGAAKLRIQELEADVKGKDEILGATTKVTRECAERLGSHIHKINQALRLSK